MGMGWCGANNPFLKKRKNEKFKKTGKTILRRFKALKIFGWYSWSFLVLDALRTHARCLKIDFMRCGMVVKSCKGSKMGKNGVGFEIYCLLFWYIANMLLILQAKTIEKLE